MKTDFSHKSLPNYEALHASLEMLEKNYGEFLKQESMTQEVAILKYTVEDYLNGSPEAGAYLKEHACQILDDVKHKLDGVVIEQTRLLDEVQTADHFTGLKADRASKASATVAAAQATLDHHQQ
jgi:chemotaxis regulatin CheY-phosphate phosphatase CheZ